ncbi:MAG: septum formation protein Maf [Lachnospiraceae bacterium]|nr:septum formation protein Maf [Lachnospiraceae bacterium]MBR5761900.1 septum formation protein Maf [Lachnospiraceae bacterium]MBR5992938.1 septum formation protein Maf [Lachnospiraceae bacterium]
MVILASGSPRRKELLTQAGIAFEVITSDADETPTKTVPAEIVMELSQRKGEDVYERLEREGRIDKTGETLIISADTLVFFKDERLGKPKDKADAFRMIKELSGDVHDVITGVTLTYVNQGQKKQVRFFEKTEVSVYDLTDEEIEAYIATGEPMDKAGAYAIQGFFGKYIKGINGEYANVVGLPIARLYHEIKKLGCKEALGRA